MNNKDDFKYILQDTGHIYFGKELTYAEMMENKDVPFKFKAIIGSYISKDVDTDITIQMHMISMDEKSFSYKIFDQLKLEVKYFYKKEAKGIFGKKRQVFAHESVKLQKLTEIKDKLSSGEYVIEEISISKLGLMMISI